MGYSDYELGEIMGNELTAHEEAQERREALAVRVPLTTREKVLVEALSTVTRALANARKREAMGDVLEWNIGVAALCFADDDRNGQRLAMARVERILAEQRRRDDD